MPVPIGSSPCGWRKPCPYARPKPPAGGVKAKRKSASNQIERPMKTNLLLIVVRLAAIASCIAVSQRPADCVIVKTTWMSKVVIGCPE